MGLWFKGYEKKGGEMKKRREWRKKWNERVFEEMKKMELIMVVGKYEIEYKMKEYRGRNIKEKVKKWRNLMEKKRNKGRIEMKMKNN